MEGSLSGIVEKLAIEDQAAQLAEGEGTIAK